MRERVITLSLEQWLRTAGPERLCNWLATVAEEIAVKDGAGWRHWAEIAERFRDFARTLPVALVALAVLTGCAAETKPQVVDLHPQLTADETLIREQGQLLAHYDAALVRAEAIMRRATAALAATSKEKAAANAPDQFTRDPLAAAARSAAKATE
jgi:hypothetical protein